MASDPPIVFGRFEWRPAQRVLLADGQPAALGARALDLLAVLLANRDRVVTKDELLDQVWPHVVVEENNLQVHVSALRKVLGAPAIATVPGRGYRFTAATADARPPSPEPAPAPAAAGAAVDAGVRASRLPAAPGPLIGRDAELADLMAEVQAHGLLTVLGAGGIGKTRLALAAATALQARWPGGACWVDAAPIADPTQLVPALAQALRLPLDAAAADGDAARVLATALQGQSLLLVLDNCEHLLEPCARLALALRAQAPDVRLLLTSQAPLGVPGEQLFRLAPLAVPAEDDAGDVASYGAVRLFAERTRAADPRFALGAANAAAAAEICRRLDGLPLAIELAAARVRLLGVQGVRDRLSERLRLLSGGQRHVLPRHQTLRAALEWSHSLLEDREQAVLRRLGVFVGGFTMELAQQVASDEAGIDGWAVLEGLAVLVDRSLVVVDSGEPPRYGLLETMRAHALERLAASGETARCASRHAHAVAALFVATDEARYGDGGQFDNRSSLQRLGPEMGNARAALAWALSDSGDRGLAVQLAGAAATTFLQLGHTQELMPTMQALLADVDRAPPVAQVTLLWRYTYLASFCQVASADLLDIDRDAVRRARAAGSRRRLIGALCGLCASLSVAGEFAAVAELMAEMAGLERPDDPAYVRAWRLGVDAGQRLRSGDAEGALVPLSQVSDLLRGATGEGAAFVIQQSLLSMVLNGLGRHDEAAARALEVLDHPDLPSGFPHPACEAIQALCETGRAAEALQLARRTRRTWHAAPLGQYGDKLARLAEACGRPDDAWRLVARLARACAEAGQPLEPDVRAYRDALRLRCLGGGASEQALERWAAEGAALDEPAVHRTVARLCDGQA